MGRPRNPVRYAAVEASRTPVHLSRNRRGLECGGDVIQQVGSFRIRGFRSSSGLVRRGGCLGAALASGVVGCCSHYGVGGVFEIGMWASSASSSVAIWTSMSSEGASCCVWWMVCRHFGGIWWWEAPVCHIP